VYACLLTTAPAHVRNNGGAIAASIIGDLAVGAMIGSQTNRG
jgi:hypothetical protein